MAQRKPSGPRKTTAGNEKPATGWPRSIPVITRVRTGMREKKGLTDEEIPPLPSSQGLRSPPVRLCRAVPFKLPCVTRTIAGRSRRSSMRCGDPKVTSSLVIHNLGARYPQLATPARRPSRPEFLQHGAHHDEAAQCLPVSRR